MTELLLDPGSPHFYAFVSNQLLWEFKAGVVLEADGSHYSKANRTSCSADFCTDDLKVLEPPHSSLPRPGGQSHDCRADQGTGIGDFQRGRPYHLPHLQSRSGKSPRVYHISMEMSQSGSTGRGAMQRNRMWAGVPASVLEQLRAPERRWTGPGRA